MSNPTFDLSRVSRKGRDRENDLDVPKGSDRLLPRRSGRHSFYIQKGRIKVVVLSAQGKEAVVGILEKGQFFGEGCLDGHAVLIATTTAIEECLITAITKAAMIAVLNDEPKFLELFVAYLLTRNSRVEEDMIDQLFNSSERRLARLLLLLAKARRARRPLSIPISVRKR
jgi:CRP/FNR family transcriptional regulator, cyclic AMP receptor protein